MNSIQKVRPNTSIALPLLKWGDTKDMLSLYSTVLEKGTSSFQNSAPGSKAVTVWRPWWDELHKSLTALVKTVSRVKGTFFSVTIVDTSLITEPCKAFPSPPQSLSRSLYQKHTAESTQLLWEREVQKCTATAFGLAAAASQAPSAGTEKESHGRDQQQHLPPYWTGQ